MGAFMAEQIKNGSSIFTGGLLPASKRARHRPPVRG